MPEVELALEPASERQDGREGVHHRFSNLIQASWLSCSWQSKEASCTKWSVKVAPLFLCTNLASALLLTLPHARATGSSPRCFWVCSSERSFFSSSSGSLLSSRGVSRYHHEDGFTMKTEAQECLEDCGQSPSHVCSPRILYNSRS